MSVFKQYSNHELIIAVSAPLRSMDRDFYLYHLINMPLTVKLNPKDKLESGLALPEGQLFFVLFKLELKYLAESSDDRFLGFNNLEDCSHFKNDLVCPYTNRIFKKSADICAIKAVKKNKRLTDKRCYYVYIQPPRPMFVPTQNGYIYILFI